jgi:hypothetical protein
VTYAAPLLIATAAHMAPHWPAVAATAAISAAVGCLAGRLPNPDTMENDDG